jgi:hypothetical protein
MCQSRSLVTQAQHALRHQARLAARASWLASWTGGEGTDLALPGARDQRLRKAFHGGTVLSERWVQD